MPPRIRQNRKHCIDLFDGLLDESLGEIYPGEAAAVLHTLLRSESGVGQPLLERLDQPSREVLLRARGFEFGGDGLELRSLGDPCRLVPGSADRLGGFIEELICGRSKPIRQAA